MNIVLSADYKNTLSQCMKPSILRWLNCVAYGEHLFTVHDPIFRPPSGVEEMWDEKMNKKRK